jgi:hypothetical protein
MPQKVWQSIVVPAVYSMSSRLEREVSVAEQ